MTDNEPVDRWKSEAQFFDQEARRARASLAPMSPDVVDRYARKRRRRWNLEHRLQLLGSLARRRVLDVGCGDGDNAILLAKLGAHVTGFDVSPQSVELARDKALLNGVAERVNFVCAPIESVDLSDNKYDIVWVDAVLHHVIPALRPTLDTLRRALVPGGQFIASEPVNLSPILRAIRLRLPISINATPDERPLEAAELDVIDQVFPMSSKYYYHGFGRALRWILRRHQYENASIVRRAIADLACSIDVALLSMPPARPFAGVCVVHWKDPGA